MTISQPSTDLRHNQRMQMRDADAPTVAAPTQSVPTVAESESPACCQEDRLHPYWEVIDDEFRMRGAFTEFADALVPFLAGLAVERPEVVTQDFDLRKDDGRLGVIDTDMAPQDIAWLESRLNSHPRLAKLAARFNESVVGAYGDVEHPYYMVETGVSTRFFHAIPGLADTVDRDVSICRCCGRSATLIAAKASEASTTSHIATN
jgi:hypothetical protein